MANEQYLDEYPITIIKHYQRDKYNITSARKEVGGDGKKTYIINYVQLGLRWLATWAQEGPMWLPQLKCLGPVKKEESSYVKK